MKQYTVNEAREILIKYFENGKVDCKGQYCANCVFDSVPCNDKLFDNEYLSKAEAEIAKREAEIAKREEQVDWSKIAVDTKVLVRDNESDEWQKRYFFKFRDNKVYTFVDGATSWSYNGAMIDWNYAKLYKEAIGDKD